MKFCKNLQRVVEISDPEWAPYWTNYKMLKKLIKELPSLVPADDALRPAQRARSESNEKSRPGSPSSVESSAASVVSAKQQHGDKTTEKKRKQADLGDDSFVQHEDFKAAVETINIVDSSNSVKAIGQSPGEVAFFKLIHAEFKKATHFFNKAQEEFIIREERVREGMEIMKKPNSIMVNEKWSLLAKSLYRLYKDLLLLETFAIMTYCSFSKILKKHDKVTGFNTRNAFMANVVNNANFTSYPVILEMINRCEELYEQVSDLLLKEGKEGLYEDERLFINMIHRLNEQVMDSANDEGIPERKEVRRPPAGANVALTMSVESKTTSSLRSLVADMNSLGQVSESEERKKRTTTTAATDESTKRPKQS